MGSFHTLKLLLTSVLKADHGWWEEQSLFPLASLTRLEIVFAFWQNAFTAFQKWPLADCSASIELHWCVENKPTSKTGWEGVLNCKAKFFPLNGVTEI